MRPTERSAQRSSAKTGLFAALRAILGANGSGAPSRTHPALLIAALVAVAMMFTASPAFGVYVPTGSFESGTGGVAVNDITGDIYVAHYGRVAILNSDGNRLNSFDVNEFPVIAVDNGDPLTDPSAGDVYVSIRIEEPGENSAESAGVDKFSATGEFLGEITEGFGGVNVHEQEKIEAMAVESDGVLWIKKRPKIIGFGVTEGPGQIETYSDALENKLRSVETVPYAGLEGAVDFTNSDIYQLSGGGNLGEMDTVGWFNSGGTLIERFGAETLDEEAKGIAVNWASAAKPVYVVEGGEANGRPFESKIFEDLDVPTETTGAVAELGGESVTLNGKVNPEGEPVTSCEFEYDTNTAYGKTAPCEHPDAEELGSASSPVAVSAKLSGLALHTTYDYRLVAADKIGKDNSEYATFLTLGPEVSDESSTPVGPGGATVRAQINPGSKPTAYHVEYGTSVAYGSSTPEVSAGAGAANVAVSQQLSGLQPSTEYHYRFVAVSKDGTAYGPGLTFTTFPPTIGAESTSYVESTRARLEAEISPAGYETAYHFEYGTAAGVYDVSVPVPDAYTSASLTYVKVNVLAKGLKPDTTYHYRVVVPNALPGEVDGPDETFTTRAAPSTASETCPNAQARTEQPFGTALPDCRAYELVSPLDKSDHDAEAIDSRASVSDESPAVAYVSQGSFSEPQGAEKLNRYVARREADGWSTQSLTPPSVAYGAGRVAFAELLFTPSLSEGLLLHEDVPLVEGEPEGYVNLYVADLASTPASYQTVTNVTPPGVIPYGESDYGESGEPKAVGVSTDLSHVVFQQGSNLTANAKGTEEKVYEWTGGKLSLVDVPPAGVNFEQGAVAGAPGDFYLPEDGDVWHAVSANGLRVFFTAGEGSSGNSEGQLYVRENPEREEGVLGPKGECIEPAKACTVMVSKSQRTNGNGEPEPDPNDPVIQGYPFGIRPAYFRDANAGGTRVFFTSRAELTNNANTGPADNTANLYEYNVETKELTDVTSPTKAEDPKGAAVLGLVNAGENAGEENSYVYFVANGVLASNENPSGETAQRGNCRESEEESLTGEHTCSLYVAHYNGGRSETKFVATVSYEDETDWDGYEGGGLNNDNDNGPGNHTVRVTPDGTMLAFESERSLTGYDNEPVEPGSGTGRGAGLEGNHCTKGGGPLDAGDPAVPCREVYLYDAVTEKLVCASCDPSGARPVGPAELGGQEPEEGNGFSEPSVYYLPRNLSESGGRLFFQSPDALVPQDSNGKRDVYEWELPASAAELAKGENSCTSSSLAFSAGDGGCVLPISDVAGDFESRFMDATPSGDNVFIATKDQLVLEADADSRANVYDVRVGGGFPVSSGPPACNSGDACKPPVSPQPSIFAPSGSATFSGLGNPPPAVVAPPPLPKKTAKKTVKCEKGFVKDKKGQCVKRKKPKKRSAKKSAHVNRRAK